MKEKNRKRCVNPICGGNGNCDTCRLHVLLEKERTSFEVISEHKAVDNAIIQDQKTQNEYSLVVDIGTTTLVFVLIDNKTGRECHTVTMINSQRKYGFDVISRIQASVNGQGSELQDCIREDLLLGIDRMEKDFGIHRGKIKKIFLVGNTTMIHLLKGYNCETLGTFPFTPIEVDWMSEPVEKTLGIQAEDMQAEVTILPAISTYVGSDIVAGLYACGFADTEDIGLFIDLGTNGEMAIGNKDRILVTSVAAGPAFEGGNITWGTGSIAGAICAVSINGEKTDITTIHGKTPCGICGTGVIEIVAELVRNGFVDETGLLSDEFFETGFTLGMTAGEEAIVFTQKDIREFQLAKAAVRAAIEILAERYKVTTQQIKKVYLAGGFGYHVNVEKCALVGLLPKELAAKTEAVGNSSLAGALLICMEKGRIKELQQIRNVSEEIILANDEYFNEKYVKAMHLCFD